MTQKRVRRRSHSEASTGIRSESRSENRLDSRSGGRSSRPRQVTDRGIQERRNSAWIELRTPDASASSFQVSLTNLIEENAPLKTNTSLVLMYGPFQAEMESANGQGVASWLRECVRKHGLPSLLRFDYRQRAQVFRRDQFQSWLEPLLARISS